MTFIGLICILIQLVLDYWAMMEKNIPFTTLQEGLLYYKFAWIGILCILISKGYLKHKISKLEDDYDEEDFYEGE